MRTRGIRGAALLLALFTAAGCGSGIGGTAQPAEIDVRTLDVGKYSTAPLEERYTYYPDLGMGLNLAAMRLADHVATGPEIDAKLGYGTGMKAFLHSDGGTNLAKTALPVLDANGMLFGVSASNAEKPRGKNGKIPENITFTALTVIQFPDGAAATKAAAELDAADFAFAADVNQPLTLTKYPAAHAHWRPDVPTMGSTLAHGSYVVNLMVGVNSPDTAQLTALSERVYDVQLALLDGLPPLSKEGALRLPYDPDGMMRRTLNPNGIGMPDISSQFVSETRGFLNQIADQGHWTRIMKDNGMDRFALSMDMSNRSMLYRTRDERAAIALAGVILDQTYPDAADAPTALPNAKCGESPIKDDYSTKRYRCAVTYGRYMATVEGDQLSDVHQRANAQYALLANSTW
ncbi:hypothetical protein OHB26_06490 [Nocardia sp. NBC_01503]|uniref:DUF7373 family lipoprotein n=1 Tax=Nocardia sp. NBC_01503 TaxID=2975997 RepID=UPI002E7B518C|nr:hypothetical protein [Nocardia sp. NBC_01503]WTL33862.1 hypothetical protein OHB26_06490 [Nocardia sp. NBC_01503]